MSKFSVTIAAVGLSLLTACVSSEASEKAQIVQLSLTPAQYSGRIEAAMRYCLHYATSKSMKPAILSSAGFQVKPSKMPTARDFVLVSTQGEISLTSRYVKRFDKHACIFSVKPNRNGVSAPVATVSQLLKVISQNGANARLHRRGEFHGAFNGTPFKVYLKRHSEASKDVNVQFWEDKD